MKNLMICRMVEEMIVDQNPQLANPEFRKSLPKQVKIELVKMMHTTAVAMGAVPTRKMNL